MLQGYFSVDHLLDSLCFAPAFSWLPPERSPGLGITYLHEVKNEKSNLNSDFSSKVAEFSQRMTPALLKRLEKEEKNALEEVETYLSTVNYTL